MGLNFLSGVGLSGNETIIYVYISEISGKYLGVYFQQEDIGI